MPGMQVAEAFVAFLGDAKGVDKTLAGVPAAAEPHAQAVGGMFAKHLGNGVKMGLAGLAGAGIGGTLLKLSEPLGEERGDAERGASTRPAITSTTTRRRSRTPRTRG